MSIALFMTALDNLVVGVALPSIRARPRWIARVARVDGQRLHARLRRPAHHRRRARRPLRAQADVRHRPVGIFTGASALAALAPTIEALIAARAVQGLGAAIVLPLTLTLLSEAFPAEKRGMALGIWAGVSGLGVALGPFVGGAVVEGIALAVDLLAQRADRARARRRSRVRLLTESHGPADKLDLPGLGLVGRRALRR